MPVQSPCQQALDGHVHRLAKADDQDARARAGERAQRPHDAQRRGERARADAHQQDPGRNGARVVLYHLERRAERAADEECRNDAFHLTPLPFTP